MSVMTQENPATNPMTAIKPNWKESQDRFKRWWKGQKTDRPLIALNVIADQPRPTPPVTPEPEDDESKHLNLDWRMSAFEASLANTVYPMDNFPAFSLNMGPGSLALYLGSEPVFQPSTVWFSECIEDWDDWLPLRYRSDNRWFKRHTDLIREAVKRSRGRYLVDIPDIVENVDILAAMRGPQTFCFDLIDRPDTIHQALDQLDGLYFNYYDAFYDLVKAGDASSSYTAFNIWGPGKTAKVQCDFCALMNPDQFREFVQPSLRKQCQTLDHSMYHLDGPDAIVHLPALMEIDELHALQWTPGAGNPDGGDERWYPIYRQAREAGKSLHIHLGGGSLNQAVKRADRLVNTFGRDGLYLLFRHRCSEREAGELLHHAETKWEKRAKPHK